MAHDFLCQAPASLVIAEALSNQVNHADIESIIQSQKHVLGRLEKTNEMLLNCNSLSATRFALANQELKKHTQLLFDLKKDLDSVFRRIRFLKMKLSQQYPAAFSACSKVFNVLDEEDEPEEKVISAKKKAVEQADILCDASSAQKNTESTGSPSSAKSSTTSYNSDDS
ncbi:hypothetical protein HPB47_025478 [Ixodes persulcatus]|uniref:Uncharacterized protein n=1 Tax=Ixodes persulcatus TaxID=34615 RepID=A0AC60Q1C6_IXOPE|nr:hypothetical protein HPB47_025478 [Ixodes persulcatus]